VEQLSRRAAADVDAFYAERRLGPAPDEHVLVLTFDGKGIVMRPRRAAPGHREGRRRGQDQAGDPPVTGREEKPDLDYATALAPGWPVARVRSVDRQARNRAGSGGSIRTIRPPHIRRAASQATSSLV